MSRHSFVAIRRFRDAQEADDLAQSLTGQGIDARVIPHFTGYGTPTFFEVHVQSGHLAEVGRISLRNERPGSQAGTDPPQDATTKWLLGLARYLAPASMLALVFGLFLGDIHKAVLMFLAASIACVVAVLAFGVALLRGRNQRRAQVKRQARADAIADLLLANEPTPPFMAFLRPFQADGHLVHVALESTPTFTGGGARRVVVLDVEELLAFASWDLGHPLVALGRPGERFGSGYIKSSDEAWKTLATRLVTRAAVVLVVPGLSPGTRWELDLLGQLDCWEKVIFIMPPMGHGYDWAARWTETSERLAEAGWMLPAYDERGMFFTMLHPAQVKSSGLLPSRWTIGRAKKLLKRMMHSDGSTAVA